MTRSLYSGVTTAAASVTVYWAGTTTKPSIYVSSTGTTKSNPITADWLGAYSFWIDDGHYKIVNGSVAGDLTDVRISSTTEAEPGADRIAVLPFLGSTATTQQAFNEALVAGTLSQSGGTYTGPITAAGGITMGDAQNIVLNATTGTKIGTATTQKLAFFNSTPIVQRASAAQASVVTTATTQTTPYGFATQAQGDAIVTLVNELRDAMVAFGLIKGSA